MRVSRLYVNAALTPGQRFEPDADGAHYLRTVLRLEKGAELRLFNGDGSEYRATVVEAGRACVALEIGAAVVRSIESPLAVILGLGISRADRMDWALQKSVELGALRITPLQTERCVVQLKGEKPAQKTAHWQKIVQHAAEQSGRTVLPQLHSPAPLTAWLEQQQGLKIFLDPYAKTGLKQLSPETGVVTLLSGPEGGFADWERAAAQAAGFIPVCLGSRILRTETAALAALTAVQTLWGDLGEAVSAVSTET